MCQSQQFFQFCQSNCNVEMNGSRGFDVWDDFFFLNFFYHYYYFNSVVRSIHFKVENDGNNPLKSSIVSTRPTLVDCIITVLKMTGTKVLKLKSK